MTILAVNFGVPIKHRHYADSTTYMMGIVRDLIAPYDDFGRPHVPEVILPDDSDLIGQTHHLPALETPHIHEHGPHCCALRTFAS